MPWVHWHLLQVVPQRRQFLRAVKCANLAQQRDRALHCGRGWGRQAVPQDHTHVLQHDFPIAAAAASAAVAGLLVWPALHALLLLGGRAAVVQVLSHVLLQLLLVGLCRQRGA